MDIEEIEIIREEIEAHFVLMERWSKFSYQELLELKKCLTLPESAYRQGGHSITKIHSELREQLELEFKRRLKDD